MENLFKPKLVENWTVNHPKLITMILVVYSAQNVKLEQKQRKKNVDRHITPSRYTTITSSKSLFRIYSIFYFIQDN